MPPLRFGSRALRRRVLLGALALVLLVYPYLDKNNAHVDFLANAGAFILLALGLNIVVGFAGLLDLGYAAFFAIGSYSYAILASQQFNLHVPFWVMLFVAAGIAAIFGILLGAPTLRLRGDYLAIVTLGFGEIVPQTFLNLAQYTNGPNGISSLDQPSLFGRAFGFSATPYYYVLLVLIALGIAAARNLQFSRLGRAWMAIREDELAARHMGINTTAAKLAAFALGASFSGVAGVAYAAKLDLVSPDQFQFNVSVLVLSMLVLGGMGNIAGVIVGSFVLSFVNSFLLPQSTNIAHNLGFANVDFTNYRFMLYGVILVAMMLFRPEGLIPSRQRKAELHEPLEDPALGAREQAEYVLRARAVSGFFRLDHVRRTFGGLIAVSDLSFEIEAGSIVALIGPNGAGKSTVFNLITGIYPPTSGRIELEGRSLAGLRTDRITAGGIARTFQNIRLFAFMSALDNVMTGRHPRMRASMFDSLLHTPRQRAEERRVRERSRELLRFVGLERDAGDYARNLSYGSQRRLEIARALASEPKLLLLDEPGAGMNPREKEDLTGLIGRIRAQGVTVFLIEHDMNLVMALSERITVLDHGEKIAEGTPAAIRADERVIEAYLGRPDELA